MVFALAFATHFCCQPLPATELMLMLFITHLAKKLTYRSIRVYLFGVRALHIREGFNNPLSGRPRLWQTMRGIKKSQNGTRPKKLAMLPALIRAISSRLQLPRSLDDMAFVAAMWLAFFALLRCGEFTTPTPAFDPNIHLSVEDVTFIVIGRRHLKIRIKSSKTDPFRQGVTLAVPCVEPPVCCPCCLLREYLSFRRALGLTCHSRSPLFLLSSSMPMNRSWFIGRLKSSLAAIGCDPTVYSGHSFRIGGATWAQIRGVNPEQIKMLGRWASDCYESYLRTPVDLVLSTLSTLA
eukprot:Lithocolla_globosa_v1_NODE_493_length_3897_cov_316.316502.p3 type:complete len:294 gc:universal NODE_493_length_3897_cov_316.316502:2895-3776(+)